MMMMMACPLCPPLSLSLGVKPGAFALRILGKALPLHSTPSPYVLLLPSCSFCIFVSSSYGCPFLLYPLLSFVTFPLSLSAQLSGTNEDLRPLTEKRNTTYGKVSTLWFLASKLFLFNFPYDQRWYLVLWEFNIIFSVMKKKRKILCRCVTLFLSCL